MLISESHMGRDKWVRGNRDEGRDWNWGIWGSGEKAPDLRRIGNPPPTGRVDWTYQE